MSNEELIQRYKDGDVMVLKELTEKNMGLIRFTASKFHIACSYIEFDDLVQQGWTGLLRAIETYRDDLPNTAMFSTWAVYWIRQAIQRYLKRNTAKNEISLFEPIGEDLTIADSIEDPEALRKLWDAIERNDLRRELENVMDTVLTLREKEIIKLKYGWDNNICWIYEDIGRLYGITGNRTREIHQRAMSKLRRSNWGRKRIDEHWKEKRAGAEYKSTELSAEISILIRDFRKRHQYL